MTPQDSGGSALVIQTMQEAAVSHLRNLILSGQLIPGQRLLQEDLAEKNETRMQDLLKIQ